MTMTKSMTMLLLLLMCMGCKVRAPTKTLPPQNPAPAVTASREHDGARRAAIATAEPAGNPTSTPPPKQPADYGFQEDATIPPEIQQATTVADLRQYLQSPHHKVREAAVRRIADLARAKGIGPIKQAFWREPRAKGLLPNDVRQGILLALGDVHTDEAKAFVAHVLTRYERRGPRNERYIYEDGEYASVVTSAIEALTKWHSNAEVYKRLRNIALAGNPRRFDWRMREEAYKGVVLEDMRRGHITGLEQSALYLMSQLTGSGVGHWSDWVRGETGVKTPEAIKNHAIVQMLISYGEGVVPYVQRALDNLPESEKERKEALEEVIRCINQSRSRPATPMGADPRNLWQPYVLERGGQDRLLHICSWYRLGCLHLCRSERVLAVWLLG